SRIPGDGVCRMARSQEALRVLLARRLRRRICRRRVCRAAAERIVIRVRRNGRDVPQHVRFRSVLPRVDVAHGRRASGYAPAVRARAVDESEPAKMTWLGAAALGTAESALRRVRAVTTTRVPLSNV